MASSTEPESSGYHAGDSESVYESLQDRPSVARDLMDVLKVPTQADICRKRKVATNSTIPLRNRCKRPRCASNPGPGSVTPAQRVKEFPKEELKVSLLSLLQNSFNHRQDHSLQDYLKSSLRLRVSVVPTHLIAVRLLHDIGKKIPTSSFELE